MNETTVTEPEVQGGSGVPVNETPAGQNAGGATPAAWTAQLSKELKGNAEALQGLGNFKTVSELAQAYLSAVKQEVATKTDGEGDVDLEAELEKAAKALPETQKQVQQAFSKPDAQAIKELTTKLAAEFGAGAAEYYKKALNTGGIRGALEAAGGSLKHHPDLARALVLLGREISEESSPAPTGIVGSGATRLADGARIF